VHHAGSVLDYWLIFNQSLDDYQPGFTSRSGSEFSRESARGCALAGRAAAGRDDPAVVAASPAAFVQRLVGLVQEQ
jgi:hypothetical protein